MLINKERFLEIAESNSIDVLVAATSENIAYCTEYQSTFKDVQAYAVVPVKPTLRATVVVPTSEVDQVIDGSPDINEIFPYGAFYYETGGNLDEQYRRLQEVLACREPFGSPIEGLASALRAGGFGKSRIGLDEGVLGSDIFSQVRKMLPQANLVPANAIFANIRMVKTEEEIDRLKRTTAITERAWMNALNSASEGITEKEIAVKFESGLVAESARPDFTVLAFGERTAMPNAQPSERKLRGGDCIRFDIGCVYRYYHSDISRMAVLGSPSEKLKRYYEAILQGEERGLDMARPGIRVSGIFEEMVRTVRKSGISNYRRHHCGHGIGIAPYDRPLVSAADDTILERGMVLCIETPYYELGWGGLQVEDTIVVRDDEAELLTSTDRNLTVR